jgi:hypothetical protein
MASSSADADQTFWGPLDLRMRKVRRECPHPLYWAPFVPTNLSEMTLSSKDFLVQYSSGLPPSTDFRRLFFHRLDRVVRRDCTFLLRNRFYEAPPNLAGETVEARFDPLDPALVEIYFQGNPKGTARLVDALVNGQLPSTKPARRAFDSGGLGGSLNRLFFSSSPEIWIPAKRCGNVSHGHLRSLHGGP